MLSIKPLLMAISLVVIPSTILGVQDFTNRINCIPEPDVTVEKCQARKCQWDKPNENVTAPTNVPFCYFPHTTGYIFQSKHNDSSSVTYIISRENVTENSTNPPNPYLNDGEKEVPLKVIVTNYGPSLRVWIGPNEGEPRFEPNIDLLKPPTPNTTDLTFEANITTPPFSFAVKRITTGAKLWDTSIGGLLFADQYIQIATYLPTDKMYGWGENVHHTLKHDFTGYKTWAMFGRDEPPNSTGEDTKNLYGVQPFYMALEGDGKAHGVLILNSNAQEITTGPNAHFVYRTIGGILDIYFFPGPTPEEVVKQYEQLVGNPYMPAFFALGYQLSRYGYTNLQDMKDAVDRTVNAGIPLDVPYADIDYMKNFMDFTLSDNFTELGNYSKELHEKNMKLFLMFDPAIDVTSEPFVRAKEQGVSFIKWPNKNLVPQSVQSMYNSTNGTDIMLGVVWPNNHCAFPDFLDPQNNTRDWWIQEIKTYHDKIAFDGMWIDMNEPANFGTNKVTPWYFRDPDHPYDLLPLFCNFTGDMTKYDDLKFKTHSVYVYNDSSAKISDKTLCMLGLTTRGTQILYNTKNIYGLYETKITHQAFQEVIGKRGAIITRSNYPSTGRYAGHWLGDNRATWSDLLTSIIGIQEYNLFGITYIGSDICGFHANTTEELCLRWHQLGAFYTFSRNHNGKTYIKQDPAQWPTVAAAAKTALEFRYRYLPYLYSLHFEAHLNGGSVIRPVFFEFPKDPYTHDLGMQFMWGNAMMIVPVFEAGKTTISGYLPHSSHWYSLRDNDYGHLVSDAENCSAALNEMIPVFARGGTIMPCQAPAQTTEQSRKNPLKLVIALNDFEILEEQWLMIANGFLYWDDGISYVNSTNYCKYLLTSVTKRNSWSLVEVKSINHRSQCETTLIKEIDIFGFPFEPDLKFLFKNGEVITNRVVNATYDKVDKILRLKKLDESGLFQLRPSTNQELMWWPKNKPMQTTANTATHTSPTTVTTVETYTPSSTVSITTGSFATTTTHTSPTTVTTVQTYTPSSTVSITTGSFATTTTHTSPTTVTTVETYTPSSTVSITTGSFATTTTHTSPTTVTTAQTYTPSSTVSITTGSFATTTHNSALSVADLTMKTIALNILCLTLVY